MYKSDFSAVLTKAINGNHAALERIFEMYKPLIDKHSVVDGTFDEDCRQYIMIHIAMQISKFQI